MKAVLFSNRFSELIEENRAAEEAYSQVVQSIENKRFGQLLDNCIEERIRFQEELEEAMGERNVRDVESEAHPSWLHIHEIFPTSNDLAMLDETILAENRTIDMYNAVVIDPELPADKASVLRNHIKSLRSSIIAFQQLKKMTGSEA